MTEREDVFRRPFKVRWGAFESDSYSMQREGWEFVQELNAGYGHRLDSSVLVIARHRSSAIAMWGEAHISTDLFRYGSGFVEGFIEFTGCRLDHQIQLYGGPGLSRNFRRIDMEPQVISMTELHKTGIFRDWVEPERKEIIVAPDQVADLLDRISKLQQPELLAIRERNRQREARERAPERTHATILSIAA